MKATPGGPARGGASQFRKECRNARCIHRKQSGSTRVALLRKYANMMFFSCPHCAPDAADIVNGKVQASSSKKPSPVIYCSQVCLRQDWQMSHQYECAGRIDSKGKRVVETLDPAEVKRIERSTPFIKPGQLREAGHADANEKMLANMTLDELEFDAKTLGKGSYGQV